MRTIINYPPQSLYSILFSFRRYNIGDIIHNRKKAIAAVLLSLCFIDQVSCYWAGKKATKTQFEAFVDKYLNMYTGIGLYSYFRNGIVHNYSGKGEIGIAWNINFNHDYIEIGGKKYIGSHRFVMNIIKAFKAFENDANSDITLANKITKWSETHPVLTHVSIAIPE